MKTAKEYIVKHRLMSRGIISTDSTLAEDSLIGLEQLQKILTEDRQQIISKINEMILQIRQTSNDFSSIYSLTELKQFMEEK